MFNKTLLQSPYLVSTGSSNFIPGTNDMVQGPISADGSADQQPKFVRRGAIDDGFLPTMNIALIAGRNFSRDFPADASQHVIVNETLVRTFGLKDPIGEKIRLGDKGNPNFLVIIGVIKDFHQSSLHHAIEPHLFQLKPTHHIAIKVEKDLQAGMRHIENSWAKVFPDEPFTYNFLDDKPQNSYETDQIRGKVFLLFSLSTIFIAFLGLFGLASYLAKQRIKEVGIRKVLGASSGDIVVLMTRNFLFLVLSAALPAFLAAWYVVNQWLENFAFRTEMSYPLYGWVLAAILLLTLITTGLHAIRAAQLNPAEKL